MIRAPFTKCLVCVVQPWFPEPGHPAACFTRFLRGLRHEANVRGLVFLWSGQKADWQHEYLQTCHLETVRAPSLIRKLFGTLTVGTVVCLGRLYIGTFETRAILFFDSQIHILALLACIFSHRFRRIDALVLKGPEESRSGLLGKCIKWPVLSTALAMGYIRLWVRTEELRDAWVRACPISTAPVGVLANLDLLGTPLFDRAVVPAAHRIFVIAGQIRPEKCVESLFNVFASNEDLGDLRIAGRIVCKRLASVLSVAHNNIRVDDRHLSEAEMRECIAAAHYQLLLYRNWDNRMEAAMLFESVKAGTPIVCFQGGWLGRMCIEHGLGWTVSSDPTQDIRQVLMSLPIPGSIQYADACERLRRFHQEHTDARAFRTVAARLGMFDSLDSDEVVL